MFFLIAPFWFIRTAKNLLFWIYLWQLKEYHFGRFLDHFRTFKGKKLIFNPLQLSKIVLLALFILGIVAEWTIFALALIEILFLIYFIESLSAFSAFFGKRLKIPKLTKKTAILISGGLLINLLILIILFLITENIFWQMLWLLILDILTPFIVSLIVLLFQPITVLWRNKLIKKATERRKEFSAQGGSALGGKDLLVIGITGSYGKTSTKEFLAEILSEKYKVLKTKKHVNAEVGIAETILRDLKKEHEILIAEIGAYNKGKIKEVCQMLQPKIGILTGINEQHMATFGSQENIIKGKYELIESLPQDGTAFFNARNKYCVELYQKTKIEKYLYGEGAKFFGEENLLGAMAVAKKLGVAEEKISSACQKIKSKLSGVQQREGINGLTIFDATYSANPDSVIGHLEYLKALPGKKIIIMPCLIELGKTSKEVHKRIGKKIAEVCDLAIITTKDRFKEIKDGSARALTEQFGPELTAEGLSRMSSPQGGKKTEVIFIENPRKIFEKIKTFCKEGDVVLLEGRLPKELIGLLNN